MPSSRLLPSYLLVALTAPALCAADDGDAERGKALYYDFACYSCHGYHATGRTPLSRDTSGILSRADVFLTYLRLRGDQNPVNPKNSMPNYSTESLSDEQALDIYAYLVSQNDPAPSLEEIPIMQELIDDAKRRADVE